MGKRSTEDLLEAAVALFLERREAYIRDLLGLQEDVGFAQPDSPIERVFQGYLMAEVEGNPGGHGFDIKFGVDRSAFWPDASPEMGQVYIVPQAKVGIYSVDFLFVIGTALGPRWLAVECDGHDFHERTKEQAKHDKSRDRYMLERGIRVMRFTGSEIWADPDKCVQQALYMLYRLEIGKG